MDSSLEIISVFYLYDSVTRRTEMNNYTFDWIAQSAGYDIEINRAVGLLLQSCYRKSLTILMRSCVSSADFSQMLQKIELVGSRQELTV